MIYHNLNVMGMVKLSHIDDMYVVVSRTVKDCYPALKSRDCVDVDSQRGSGNETRCIIMNVCWEVGKMSRRGSDAMKQGVHSSDHRGVTTTQHSEVTDVYSIVSNGLSMFSVRMTYRSTLETMRAACGDNMKDIHVAVGVMTYASGDRSGEYSEIRERHICEIHVR